ncbi:MAG: cell division protein FtsW [Agathobacter sp.]|nr:cell division protein FtsW [Agathobacter sp.]
MAEKKREVKKRKEKAISYFDYNLLFLVIFLVCFGLVMLYSSSSYLCANSAKYGYDGAYYLKLQLRNYIIGVFGMVFFIAVPYRKWKNFGWLAYLVSFALCVLVIFIGSESHGQARWIYIGPIGFQPSEVAKVGVIVFLAMLLEKIPKQLKSWKNLAKVFGLLIPIVAAVAYNNLSTAIIIMGIAVCMLFVASPKYSHFIAVGLVGVCFVVVFILTAGYRLDRVKAWLDPETADPAKVYQTLQGLYAIGSGGLFGKGLGESLQKLGNVPESQNDMIFTIICEELGLFGAVCVILLFMLIIWRMMVISNNAPDLFGSLLVVGVMSHIAIQVILNIAVVTNSIPNTGVILPFISYGGTSILILMCEIGLVLGVSRSIRLENIK